MRVMLKQIKSCLKPVILPFLIKLAQLYVFLFYFRLKNKDLFRPEDYVKCSHVPLRFVNHSHFTFGICRNLAKNKKYNRFINYATYIEHGVDFGNLMENIDYASNVITMSTERLKCLTPLFETTAVGPYIAYADCLFNISERKLLKKKIGMVLLVFPVHSINTVNAIFDEELLIEKIEAIRHNYDTIIVCVYYDDFIKGRSAVYTKMDYKIVSAGERNDPYFLSRLKTILELSTHCLTNGVGTHIGYAIYHDKPVMLFQQKVEHRGHKEDFEQNGYGGEIFINYKAEYEKTIKQFNMIFNEKPIITPQQLEFVERYWGTSYVCG